MIERILAVTVVAFVILLVGSTIWIRHEQARVRDLSAKIELVERQLAAARVSREVLTDLDKGLREVGRDLDQAKRESKTITDAVDWIERMERR